MSPSLSHRPPPVTKNPPQDLTRIPAQRMANTHRISTTAETRHKINERERRTHILRKMPVKTRTEDLIAALIVTLERYLLNNRHVTAPEHISNVVSSVVRDINDRRRWYITYASYEWKRGFAALGYTVGDVIIQPEHGDVQAMIPDPPFYLDQAELLKLLEPFGTIAESHFSTTQGIRSGAFHFGMTLKESARLPQYLDVDGHLFQVIDKGSLKQCSNCDSFGHIRSECRSLAAQRFLNLEKRAEAELASQEKEDMMRAAQIREEESRRKEREQYEQQQKQEEEARRRAAEEDQKKAKEADEEQKKAKEDEDRRRADETAQREGKDGDKKKKRKKASQPDEVLVWAGMEVDDHDKRMPRSWVRDFYKWSHTLYYQTMELTYTGLNNMYGIDTVLPHIEWSEMMQTEKYKNLSYKDKVDIYHNSLPKEFTDRADVRNALNAAYKQKIKDGDGSFPYSTVEMQNFVSMVLHANGVHKDNMEEPCLDHLFKPE